jgi:hypothetical protein
LRWWWLGKGSEHEWIDHTRSASGEGTQPHPPTSPTLAEVVVVVVVVVVAAEGEGDEVCAGAWGARGAWADCDGLLEVPDAAGEPCLASDDTLAAWEKGMGGGPDAGSTGAPSRRAGSSAWAWAWAACDAGTWADGMADGMAGEELDFSPTCAAAA